MKILILLAAVGLAACDMDHEQVMKVSEKCVADGGTPVKMVTLYGKVRRVECW